MRSNTKVFWHDEEKAALGELIDELVNVTKGYTYLSALELAQTRLLPEARRRRIKFWPQVRAQLLPYVEKAKNERELVALQERERVPPPAPVLSIEDLLVQLTKSVLLKALADPAVQGALREVVGQALPSVADSKPAQSPALPSAASFVEPAKKPKVLIAGLLPAQAETVRKSYDQVFDLRFWGSNESKEHLRNMLKHSQAAIGITSFISHAAEAILKDTAACYVKHPGGIKTLKATLEDLRQSLNKQQQAALH